MTRILLVFGLLMTGCGRDQDDEAAEETEEVPIGPGSDSTTLMPRDTPMTSREASPPVRDSAPDTTR